MNEDSAHFPPVDPVKTGIKGCCPRCGQGKLFDGLLGLKPRCASCGLNYAFADSGDGPAVFEAVAVRGRDDDWLDPALRQDRRKAGSLVPGGSEGETSNSAGAHEVTAFYLFHSGAL